MILNLKRSVPVLVMALLTACGSDEPPAAESDAMAIDSTIVTNVPREPLTEVDLMGLELANLSLELPWTANVVSRDPRPAAARTVVEMIQVSAMDEFDRVAFTFADRTPFPGYRIGIVDASTPIRCNEQDTTLGVETERALLIELNPAWAEGEGDAGLRAGIRSLSDARLAESGIVCDSGQRLTLAIGIVDGEELRVLEFRNPQRLMLDLR